MKMLTDFQDYISNIKMKWLHKQKIERTHTTNMKVVSKMKENPVLPKSKYDRELLSYKKKKEVDC